VSLFRRIVFHLTNSSGQAEPLDTMIFTLKRWIIRETEMFQQLCEERYFILRHRNFIYNLLQWLKLRHK
ncbi:MAG: hypothetical protein VW907_03440, partial [Opitutae bacterium]